VQTFLRGILIIAIPVIYVYGVISLVGPGTWALILVVVGGYGILKVLSETNFLL